MNALLALTTATPMLFAQIRQVVSLALASPDLLALEQRVQTSMNAL
jgi:hypothetical protein